MSSSNAHRLPARVNYHCVTIKPGGPMSKHILSVSYDENLLDTRRALLEKRGHQVTSALGFTQSAARCAEGNFDLFILGHSIPIDDKQELIRIFRANCAA